MHQLWKHLDAFAKFCSHEIWIHAARPLLDHRVSKSDVRGFFHEAHLQDQNPLINVVNRRRRPIATLLFIKAFFKGQVEASTIQKTLGAQTMAVAKLAVRKNMSR